MNYKLGILGGMGPEATCDLYKRIIKHTKSNCDQDHINAIILNKCDIPDRTKYLMDGIESPVDALNEGIEELIKLGCDYFIMPCNTAHAFADQFKNLDKIKFINMIDCVKEEIKNKFNNKKICVLCTKGTKLSKLYDDNLMYYPNNQEKIMNVVNNTKAGIDDTFNLQSVVDEESKNYDVFLLACTEISTYKDRIKTDKIIIDAVDILVKNAILACGKEYIE